MRRLTKEEGREKKGGKGIKGKDEKRRNGPVVSCKK
jgi:hypothetical protein